MNQFGPRLKVCWQWTFLECTVSQYKKLDLHIRFNSLWNEHLFLCVFLYGESKAGNSIGINALKSCIHLSIGLCMTHAQFFCSFSAKSNACNPLRELTLRSVTFLPFSALRYPTASWNKGETFPSRLSSCSAVGGYALAPWKMMAETSTRNVLWFQLPFQLIGSRNVLFQPYHVKWLKICSISFNPIQTLQSKSLKWSICLKWLLVIENFELILKTVLESQCGGDKANLKAHKIHSRRA